VQRLKKELKDFLELFRKKYSQNPIPFTWTKGPEPFQRIIEATKSIRQLMLSNQRKGRR